VFRIEMVVHHCGLAKLKSVEFGMLGLPADDAGLKLAAEQLNSERIERGSNGRNLIQDIDAIPILLDHALDTGDLLMREIRSFTKVLLSGVSAGNAGRFSKAVEWAPQTRPAPLFQPSKKRLAERLKLLPGPLRFLQRLGFENLANPRRAQARQGADNVRAALVTSSTPSPTQVLKAYEHRDEGKKTRVG
jgi:hypothetical protein